MNSKSLALEYNLNPKDEDFRYVKLNAQNERFRAAQLEKNGKIRKDEGKTSIPVEILRDVFPFLKRDFLGKCQLVCGLWNEVIKDPRNNLPYIEIKNLTFHIVQDGMFQVKLEFMNHQQQTILYESDDEHVYLFSYDFLKISYIRQLYLSVGGYFGEEELSLLVSKIIWLSTKISQPLNVKSFEVYYINCDIYKRIEYLGQVLGLRLKVSHRIYVSTSNSESSVEILYFLNELSKYGTNLTYNTLNGFNPPRDFVPNFYEYFLVKKEQLSIEMDVVMVSDDQNQVAEDFLRSIGEVKCVRHQRDAVGNHVDFIYSTEKEGKTFECRIAKHIHNSVIYASIK